MCGRFTLFEADKILSKEFGVSGFPSLSPRYNIAPSQPIAAVRATTASSREIAFLGSTPPPTMTRSASLLFRFQAGRSHYRDNPRGQTIGEFIMAVYNYPTLSDAYKYAA